MNVYQQVEAILERHNLQTPEAGEPVAGWFPKIIVALEYLGDLASAGSTLAKQLPCNGDREVEDAIRNYIIEVKRITEGISVTQAMPKLQGQPSCPIVERHQGLCDMLPKYRTDD